MYKTSSLVTDLKKIVEISDNIMISGAPGIGKSQITYEVCQQNNLSIYEIRLYEEGESAAGLPTLAKDVTKFTKPIWFKVIEEQKPDVVFLDDFHLVPPAIQSYLYRFLTDRKIHNFTLPYRPKVIVAGNFNIDSASSCDIQSPIMSRFDIVLDYDPTKEFLDWAKKTKRIHPFVLGYLTINPEDIYTEDPPQSHMFPCPRTWEYLSKFGFKNSWEYAPGIVGQDVGAKFLDFLKIVDKSLDELLESKFDNIPEQVRAAVAFSHYALNADKSVLSRIVRNVETFHEEAQFLFIKFLYDKNPQKALSLVNTKLAKNIISMASEIV